MGIFGRRRSRGSRGTPHTSPQTTYRQLDAAPPLKGSPQAPTAQGATCRICLSDEGELITPCACRGDSAHVHVACLARWARSVEPRVDAWRRCGVCLTTYSGAGAVALAEEFLERSLRKESHYIPAARHALGAALLNCGDSRAAATLERALREKRSYGEDGPNVAAVLNDLGIASGEEERFREALEIYTHRNMLETKDAACARLNLGNALCRRGRYREAKHEYERALSVLTQMHPGNDADVAKALGNLGVVSDYNGAYDEAIDYHKRALNMQRAVFGRDAVTSDVANSHENLGVALGHRGDYVEAERHLEACVEMRRSLPSQNRAVVRALAKLHEVRARRARECPQAPQRAPAASRVASIPPGVVLPYLPAA
jgi:tetratricopeptide (TPR) repeat protein